MLLHTVSQACFRHLVVLGSDTAKYNLDMLHFTISPLYYFTLLEWYATVENVFLLFIKLICWILILAAGWDFRIHKCCWFINVVHMDGKTQGFSWNITQSITLPSPACFLPIMHPGALWSPGKWHTWASTLMSKKCDSSDQPTYFHCSNGRRWAGLMNGLDFYSTCCNDT